MPCAVQRGAAAGVPGQQQQGGGHGLRRLHLRVRLWVQPGLRARRLAVRLRGEQPPSEYLPLPFLPSAFPHLYRLLIVWAQIFPTSVRAKGLNLAASAGSVGSAMVAQAWPVGVDVLGSNVYFIFMVVNLACIPVSSGDTCLQAPIHPLPLSPCHSDTTSGQDHIPLLPRDKGALPRGHGRALREGRGTPGRRWGRWGSRGCTGCCRGTGGLTCRAGTRVLFSPVGRCRHTVA